MADNIKVFLEKLNGNYLPVIQKGFAYLDLTSRVKQGDAIFIKPNLTFPYYKKGVMTSPECIEQLIVALKDYSTNIIIGESDGGGYNRFSMEDVFEKTGLKAMAKKYNVKLVNLSRLVSREIYFEYKSKEFSIPLPTLLLDEVQLFITVPVPKVHSNTYVSMSIKNQWGCIQEPALRLRLHPFFKRVIFEINRALNVQFSLIDGQYGLNRNGPMRGDVVDLGWMMLANNIIAADMTCCALMGINPMSVDYLAFLNKNKAMPAFDDIQFNRDFRTFSGPKFYLKREFWDYPGYFTFRFTSLAYLAYFSPLAGFLHNMLYLFRDKFYDHE